MNNHRREISFPLDSDGFFRRQCPSCRREFKVLVEKSELTSLADRGLDSFMVETTGEDEKLELAEYAESKLTCPYCGELAGKYNWWTQQQLAYIRTVARNVAVKSINEELIRPLKRAARRTTSGFVSLKFEGKEIREQEAWMPPEADDLEAFELACCNRMIKIQEDWSGVVYCFFCGFPHQHKSDGSQTA